MLSNVSGNIIFSNGHPPKVDSPISFKFEDNFILDKDEQNANALSSIFSLNLLVQ